MYGTAWKEDRTEGLVREALSAGFRAIDTANQRKHYHEAGVGAALKSAGVPRDELFLQTKFTHASGQDHRLPYDAAAPVARQVEQSFASSLEHLGIDHLDAYVLHGPSQSVGLAQADWDAWRAMEALQRAGSTRAIGISNVSAAQLAQLHERASVKPTAVQNRTLAWPRADAQTRAFCRDHDITYEGFSLLTAAPGLLAHPTVRAAAARTGATPAAVMLRFWVEQGVVVLTGTTSPQHMKDDLATESFRLSPDESASLARIFG